MTAPFRSLRQAMGSLKLKVYTDPAARRPDAQRLSLRWLRRVRFWKKGTPLFLYKEDQLKKILADAGVTKYDWINLDRDYLIVADV